MSTPTAEIISKKLPQGSVFKQCVTLSTQNVGKGIFLQKRDNLEQRVCFQASIYQELSSF